LSAAPAAAAAAACCCQVDEVKGIMLQNVEQVLVRGERLDVLVDRTDDLRDQVNGALAHGSREVAWLAVCRAAVSVPVCASAVR
jgi:hypothetical protein